MITSKTGQTADTANYIHGTFVVKVGSDYSTYQQIMQYAMQDEINGTTTAPALDSNVSTALNSVGDGDDNYIPSYFSRQKCRDTSLGGNDAINPLPQFGYDDDISHPHFQNPFGAGVGMGQVYSENYDDTQQILYLGFGIPVYNNLGSFWSSATDLNLANFVNKGSTITAEQIGELVGKAPIKILQAATIPFKFIGAAFDTLQQVPITKYYSFSSNMPMYFRFVNTILVMLATNMNMMGSSYDLNLTGSNASATNPITLDQQTTSSTDMSGMATIFSAFGLDMAKIMTKRYLYENGNIGTIQNRYTDQAMFQQSAMNGPGGVSADLDATTPTTPTANTTNSTTDTSTSADADARFWSLGWFDGFRAAFGGAIYDGHLFIGFRIDKGMGTSESFSNSVGESQIAQQANAKFQEGREASFDTMSGNFGKGFIGATIGGIVDGVKGVVTGVAAAFKADPLAAVMSGTARINIPDVWMSSSYNRTASFSITCMSPYGDFESIFCSEYVPLACMLAGTLPRGTGHSSHSSPFVCQAYCRGVFSSPLCIIESLEVTRGADQYGFTAARLPLEVTMHVTLKDLSPAMYMNMGGTTSLGALLLGSDDNFGEYMQTLSGMGLRDRLSPYKQMRRKAEIMINTIYKNRLSPFMLGMEGGSRFMISRMISTIVSGGSSLPNN